MKMKYTFVILSILLSCRVSITQNYYRLTNGPIIISGIYNDSLVIVESNQLYFIFDYLTNSVTFSLPVKSLVSNDYQIDSLIANSLSGDILFNGKIVSDYDATEDHPPINATIEGNLNYGNSSIPLFFNVIITHLLSGPASCNLSATINLDIAKYYNNAEVNKVNGNINIIFNELILIGVTK